MEKVLCQNSGSLLKDAQGIIEQARQEAYRSVNIAMIQRNWLLASVSARRSCWERIVRSMVEK